MLGLQVVNNKLLLFHRSHNYQQHKIGYIYKTYTGKVNLKDFLELRKQLNEKEKYIKEQNKIKYNQLGFKNFSAN